MSTKEKAEKIIKLIDEICEEMFEKISPICRYKITPRTHITTNGKGKLRTCACYGSTRAQLCEIETCPLIKD